MNPNKLFDYTIIAQDFFVQRLYSNKYVLFVLSPLIFILGIFGEEQINILVVLVSIIFVSIAFLIHFFYIPLDKIYITEKHFVIEIYNNKNTYIEINDILEFSSNTSLKFDLKSGEQFILKYGEWYMPQTKVRELTSLLKNLLETTEKPI